MELTLRNNLNIEMETGQNYSFISVYDGSTERGQGWNHLRRFSIEIILISLFCFLLNWRQPGEHQAISKIHLEAVNLQRYEEESIPQH